MDKTHENELPTESAPTAEQYVIMFKRVVEIGQASEALGRIFAACGGTATPPAHSQDSDPGVNRAHWIRDQLRHIVTQHVKAHHEEVRGICSFVSKTQRAASASSARYEQGAEWTPQRKLMARGKRISTLSKWWLDALDAPLPPSRHSWIKYRDELLEQVDLCVQFASPQLMPSREWLDADVWQFVSRAAAQERGLRKGTFRSAVAPESLTSTINNAEDVALQFLIRLGIDLPAFRNIATAFPTKRPDADGLEAFLLLLGKLAVATCAGLNDVNRHDLASVWRDVCVESLELEHAHWPEMNVVPHATAQAILGRVLSAANDAMGLKALDEALKPCLRDEHGRKRAVESFLLLRLVVLVMLAPDSLGQWPVNEILIMEVDRIWRSGASAPWLLKGLWKEVVDAGVPARTAQSRLAAFVSGLASSADREFANYAMASKACSVLPLMDGARKFAVGFVTPQEPCIKRAETANNLVRRQYCQEMAERVVAIHDLIPQRFDRVTKLLHQLSTDCIEELPETTPSMRGRSPHDCQDLGYLLGYDFGRHVNSTLSAEPAAVKGLLLPVLTIPLRYSWAQKDGWFKPWVSWEAVRWLVRWHGWMDADFKRLVYEPLLAEITTNR